MYLLYYQGVDALLKLSWLETFTILYSHQVATFFASIQFQITRFPILGAYIAGTYWGRICVFHPDSRTDVQASHCRTSCLRIPKHRLIANTLEVIFVEALRHLHPRMEFIFPVHKYDVHALWIGHNFTFIDFSLQFLLEFAFSQGQAQDFECLTIFTTLHCCSDS